jgi:hypothetical protein
MDLRKIEWDSMERIHLAQGSHQCQDLVKTMMNLWAQYNVGKLCM